MIEQASLIIGDGNWAVKSDSLLGYALPQGKYTPREMSVVRATTGTRVNAEGLVEVVPYNLVQYSEQFDNAYWVKSNSTANANSTTAPNGTLTADTITITSGYGSFYIFPFETFGNTLTYSCYFKKGTANTFYFESNPSSGYIFASYNLDTEVISPSPAVISSSIENVGNGWYRCSLTAISNGSSYAAFGIYQPSAGLVGYVWGAQINEGSLKDYLPTTTRLNIARIDYSTGSPALLVEPQRTNLALYSEQFNDANWNKLGATISANATTAPNGNISADNLIPSNGTQLSWVLQNFSSVAGTTYTFSMYVKSTDFSFFQITGSSGFNTEHQNYNISNGTLASNSGVAGTITSAGNGWYRITYSLPCISTETAARFICTVQNSGTAGRLDSCTGNGTKFVSVWGAQLEAGSYATSYIPTTSASVTRNADVVSKTGITSLIGQTEGTVFWEGQVNGFGLYPQLFDLNADGNKFIQIYNDIVSGNPTIGIYVQNVSLLLSNPNIATIAFNTNFKLALGYKANDYVVYLNGTQVFANTTIGVPPTSNFGLGDSGQTASTSKKNVKATALFKTRLTNTQLAELTTL